MLEIKPAGRACAQVNSVSDLIFNPKKEGKKTLCFVVGFFFKVSLSSAREKSSFVCGFHETGSLCAARLVLRLVNTWSSCLSRSWGEQIFNFKSSVLKTTASGLWNKAVKGGELEILVSIPPVWQLAPRHPWWRPWPLLPSCQGFNQGYSKPQLTAQDWVILDYSQYDSRTFQHVSL